jgi:hypothetical protein
VNVWAVADGAGVVRAVDDRGVCVTYEADMYAVSATVASRRSTTSSRHPGRAIEGTVRFRKRGLVQCGCGSMRVALDGPHAPLVLLPGVVRDCLGSLWRKQPDGAWVRDA